MLRLLLVRHGTPEITHALLGHTDCELSTLGVQQMDNTTACLINEVDSIESSPLKRCAIFARTLAKKHHKPVNINNDLSECFFGDWDGISYQQLQREYAAEVDAYFSDPFRFTPPNAESLVQFNQRVIDAVNGIQQNHFACSLQPRTVLAITHAGVIRSLVAWALKIDYRTGAQFKHFVIDYGSLTELEIMPHDDGFFSRACRINWRPNWNRRTDDR